MTFQALKYAQYSRTGIFLFPNEIYCMNLIQKHLLQPVIDVPEFLKILIFNFLIGNADAHGKNFSLIYKNGIPSLAPAYDLLSTTIYPRLSKKISHEDQWER